jgi:flagellar assembly protein FliH
MPKNVFRPTEVINLPNRVLIEPPKTDELMVKEKEPASIETLDAAEQLPVAEKADLSELEKERQEFLQNWEQEKADMIAKAQSDAGQIINEARLVAEAESKAKTEEIDRLKQDAEQQADMLIKQARADAEQLVSEANANVNKLREETTKQAYSTGYEEGYKTGKDEVERLIAQIQKILSKAIAKRTEIIESAETQLINLVLLIAKKVIKVISENQRNVVINNVMQALNRLKARSEVVIRVNPADVQLTTQHANDFIKQLENVAGVTVVEVAAIEKGGCIVETDFGQLDARITAQLQEIEEKIMEMIPIKTMGLD